MPELIIKSFFHTYFDPYELGIQNYSNELRFKCMSKNTIKVDIYAGGKVRYTFSVVNKYARVYGFTRHGFTLVTW